MDISLNGNHQIHVKYMLVLFQTMHDNNKQATCQK